MNTQFINRAVYCFLLCSAIFSCKKFVEVPAPKNLLVNSNVFTSDASATSAMVGIYSSMLNGSSFASGSVSSINVLAGLSADELIDYSGPSLDRIQFYQNAILPTSTTLNTNVWSPLYQYTYAANEILKGLNGNTIISEAVKKQLTGEAKFIRAFCHFYLVNLFGDVPLAISDDYSINSIAGKTPASQIYQQIIADLKDAQDLLNDSYVKSDNTPYPTIASSERVRPNKAVATALLARVYLYMQDWSNADIQASSLINNTAMFSLKASVNDIFLKNSTEAIWQFMPNGLVNDATTFILSTTPVNVSLNTQLVNTFEANDSRKVNWVKYVTVTIAGQSKTYYYANKYKVNSGTVYSEYPVVFRLAEQYLIRSESKAQRNNLAEAITDLNVIRNRAGLPSYSGTIDKISVLNAILHERQVELFTEWGHRWLDLRRTGTINTVMNTVTPLKNGTWDPNWALYPIPQSQILNDPNMANSQNPGY